MVQSVVETARRVAEEVLLPDAEAVDAADRVPEAHLRALDEAGLTGLAAVGPSLDDRVDVAAALAGGCLATAFVWLQHQGALGPVATASGPVAAFAPDLATGRLRAGVVITAVRGPQPLRLSGRPGARRLDGSALWVTGWGVAQVLRVAAVDDEGAIATALVDVGPGMRADLAPLVAANASATVTLAFDGVPVPEDRLLGRVTPEEWAVADAAGLAGNGALALGVAARAATWAESEPLLAEVAGTRDALLAADVAGLPAARAACSALAVRAAAALAVHDGGRSVIRGSRADRLLREAHFLLGFGMRPAIRAALQERLGA
ncbi:acyl-CoA dehydrogenase family protein [Amnibacterium setariae]|uniref:Acyl-CoA dehydrogenase n=1 Tax=Amnibacterium setariae TaxID=2306585 RepID=A0A3A1TVU8_9MICO|nr:acyl-CoA dehydrogenase family protein [Amnibacterium setariae]RIX28383.1 acyl-CoA dehydrogenase [Amnibacterium setariae]